MNDSRPYSLILNCAALVLIAGAVFFLLSRPIPPPSPLIAVTASSSAQTASVALSATSSAATATTQIATVTGTKAASLPQPATSTAASPGMVSRIQNPYSFPSLSPELINTDAREALVNILCMPRGGSLSPTSGSGVIVDPRGIILTNAHVAQYVLLAEDPRVDLSCTIRTGAPASARWIPEVLYIPPAWVNAHVGDILNPHPTGTGEHDYALLIVTGSVDGSPLPQTFPYLTPDTREAVAFQGDSVLVASYPAEFLGGITNEYQLFPVSSFTTVGQLLTFGAGSPDVLSLGGIIEAQSGSSGGAVVNAWGRLVALIVTTSAGASTAQRDLHALALSYINSDIATQSGSDVAQLFSGDIFAKAQAFNRTAAPQLIQSYIDKLLGAH